MSVTFRLLEPQELARILPLIATLNPSLPADILAERLHAMRAQGYRCLGGFAVDDLVALCGLWSGTKFYCGKYLEVDNVFVSPRQRSQGIGKAMMAAVEALAVAEHCDVVMLDTYVTNTRSHKFYLGDGYEIIGYHMSKLLDGSRYFPGR